jgi:hypothetical protein
MVKYCMMSAFRIYLFSIFFGLVSGLTIGLIDLIPMTKCFSILLSLFPGCIIAAFILHKAKNTKLQQILVSGFLTGAACGLIWAVTKLVLIAIIASTGFIFNYFGYDTTSYLFIIAALAILMIYLFLILLVSLVNTGSALIFFLYDRRRSTIS